MQNVNVGQETAAGPPLPSVIAGARQAPMPRYCAPPDVLAARHVAACVQSMSVSEAELAPLTARGDAHDDPLKFSARPLVSTATQNVLVWQDTAVTDALVSPKGVGEPHDDPLKTLETGREPSVPTARHHVVDTQEMWSISSAKTPVVVVHVLPLKRRVSYVGDDGPPITLMLSPTAMQDVVDTQETPRTSGWNR